VGRKDRVVRLDDRARELRSRVDTELQLGLFTVVGGKTLQEESAEAGTGSSTEGVEDKETLQTRAVVSKTANLVHDGVNELFSDSVVATSI
jgi:hypothetical protein